MITMVLTTLQPTESKYQSRRPISQYSPNETQTATSRTLRSKSSSSRLAFGNKLRDPTSSMPDVNGVLRPLSKT